jgi:hypothetical protein
LQKSITYGPGDWEEAMDRLDYYRRKAQELLAIAQATRDPTAASWLRASAIGYERLARDAARVSKELRPSAA